MRTTRHRWITATMALALFVVGCGGGSDEPSVSDDSNQSAETPGDAGSSDDRPDGGDDDNTGSGGGFQVPVARYTAHGAEAATTIAPSCGQGNVDKGGDLFRFTPPEGFEWSGTSGGTSRDEITVRDADGIQLKLIEAVTPDELSLVDGWEVVGPSGTDITINGDSIPVMEVRAEGSTAYAIVDLPYLGPLPLLSAGEALGTAIVTSPNDGRPTLDEAVAVLQTVRVERCAAVGQAFIWAAAGGFAPVPSFEPDPMGKTRPDQPQPASQGIPSLSLYSAEQLAYLMPVEESRSVCAAEAVLAAWGEDPIGYLKAITPTGTFQEEFDALIADC